MTKLNPLLQAQEIQVPSFETCIKLKELGLMPPIKGKYNVYLSQQQPSEWYLSEERWSTKEIEKICELDAIFAPDLGQIRSLLKPFTSYRMGITYYYKSQGFDQFYENENEVEAACELLIWQIENLK